MGMCGCCIAATLEGVFAIPRERLGGDHVLLWRSLGACMLAMAPWGASIKVGFWRPGLPT